MDLSGFATKTKNESGYSTVVSNVLDKGCSLLFKFYVFH